MIKSKYYLILSSLTLTLCTQSYAQNILLGGFDNQDATLIQDATVAGSVAVSMTGNTPTRNANGDTEGLWGADSFTPAPSITNFAVAQAFGDLPALTITITNNFATESISLDQIHWDSNRDNWKAETDYTITAAGDIAAAGNITGALDSGSLGSWVSFDLDISSIVTSAILAPSESVTFTIDWTGQSGAHSFLVDNLSLSGSLVPMPEPSSYAMLGGLLALSCVAVRRRHL